MRHLAIVAALVAILAAAGCCASPPPRLDPKKVAAMREEVASVGSLAILWAPATFLDRTKVAVANTNADLELLLK